MTKSICSAGLLPTGLGLALMAVALGACSSADEPAAATAVKQVAAAAGHSDADLVTAVQTSTEPSLAGLRFELQERPAVGQGFHLRIQATPNQDLDKLQVSFEAPAGLELTDASPLFHLAQLKAGESQEHVLGMRADAEGVFEVRALVLSEGPKGAVTSEFAIPVLVMPPPAAAPAQVAAH